jgi:hypothetical protein
VCTSNLKPINTIPWLLKLVPMNTSQSNPKELSISLAGIKLSLSLPLSPIDLSKLSPDQLSLSLSLSLYLAHLVGGEMQSS